MKKYVFSIIAIVAVSFVLISWGSAGHYKINHDASLSFYPKFVQYNSWTGLLAAHASDADARKDSVPSEKPKHFIDIDVYNEFITHGRIPQTLDSVINIHGYSFVYENGILPWATEIAFDSLRNCFQRHDWNKAVLFASDLGHYVGDGHQPLHITNNYDGEATGNNGIHSRYESAMVEAYMDQIVYTGDSLRVIPDVKQYIFDYLYSNYVYVDSVMEADNYAKSISSNTHSTAYMAALWSKCGNFTIRLFKDASHSLAELIYTAWVQAGSPVILGASFDSYAVGSKISLEQNAPNPFTRSTKIKFNIDEDSKVLIQVKDLTGITIATIVDSFMTKGAHLIDWTPQDQMQGTYFLVLNNGKMPAVKKMVVLK